MFRVIYTHHSCGSLAKLYVSLVPYFLMNRGRQLVTTTPAGPGRVHWWRASALLSDRLTTTSYLLLDVKLSDFLDSNFLHWLMIVKNLVTFWSEMTAWNCDKSLRWIVSECIEAWKLKQRIFTKCQSSLTFAFCCESFLGNISF